MEEQVRILHESPTPPSNPALALLRRFVEGNYLYVISALVMIAGCYLLMRATPTEGGEFAAVLKGLAVLQGYELLILATAALIVKRFARLDDAFTLLAIELALLLDPTFFVNNFHTLMQSDRETGLGIWVNVVCFGLVVVKLLVLQGCLRFRLSARAFAGFVLVAALIYLSPRWLAVKEAAIERHGYFFALCWLLPLLAVALPGAEEVLARVQNSGFLSPSQRRQLPRLFLLTPAVLLPIHLGESWYVHNLTFFGAFVSPLFVAVAVRISTQPTQALRGLRGLLLVDALAACALMTALPEFSVKWLEVHNQPAPWLYSLLPLAMTGLAVTASYLAFHRVHHYGPALWRVGVLAAAAALVATVKLGVVGAAFRLAESGASAGAGLVAANPAIVAVVVCGLLMGLWWRFPNAVTEFLVLAAALSAAFLGVPYLQGHPWVFAQSVAAVLVVFSHRHSTRSDRLAAALILAAIGLVRFRLQPGMETAAVLAAELLGLAAAGLLTRERGYAVVAVLQAVVLAGLLASGLGLGAMLVGAGCLLFAAGVAVTFRKEQLLAALARMDAPPARPSAKPEPPTIQV